MFKIKLSILLLINFFLISCSNQQANNYQQKYSIAYIGGEFDGLVLKNYLMNNLKNLQIYDQNSNFEIKASINHNSNIYITNIDNTSDREEIKTNLSVQIIDVGLNCNIYADELNVSQFYIYASGDKFLSNKTAQKKIKKDNTEALVRDFINVIKNIHHKCDE